MLDLSDIHAKSIIENNGNTLGQEIYPYSLGYIRFIKSDEDTIVAYDVDGHATDNLPKAFALLKDTNPLDLAVENLSEEGMNFGISRNGIVSNLSQNGDVITVELRLWGGQPSDVVNAVISLPNTSEVNQELSFNPEEWTQTKTITFNAEQAFSEEDLQKLSANLSSNDPNFDAENMRYRVSESGEKSSFIIAQNENSSDPKHYAFEATSDLEINKELMSNIPANIKVTPSLITKSSQAKLSLSQQADKVILTNLPDVDVGNYQYELIYIDEEFNTFSEDVVIEIVEPNLQPELIVQKNDVIVNSIPFANVELNDDKGIESIDIILKSGFADDLSMNLDQNQADGLSLTWNDELNTISINGEGSVEEFNNAIQAIEINENSPSANVKKEIQINVTDKSDIEIFRKTASENFNYIQGIETSPVIKTWNGQAMSNVNLFSFSEIDSGSLIDVSGADFGENSVTVDLNFGKNAVTNFNFDISLGDNFSLASYNFSDHVNDNFMEMQSYDQLSNKAYFGGLLLTSNDNLEGEKIVSLSLNYNGDGSIQHDFADVVLENVAVGNDEEDSISMIGVSSISNNSGIFQNLSINEGEHEFHLDKTAQFNPQAINSYDAYLALKVSMLIESSNEIDGLTFEKEQIIAADFNQNGRVNSIDVVGILKEVVHISDDVDLNWLFVQSDQDLSSVNRNNTNVLNHIITEVSDEEQIEFKGILTGDVNGSWTSDMDFEEPSLEEIEFGAL